MSYTRNTGRQEQRTRTPNIEECQILSALFRVCTECYMPLRYRVAEGVAGRTDGPDATTQTSPQEDTQKIIRVYFAREMCASRLSTQEAQTHTHRVQI